MAEKKNFIIENYNGTDYDTLYPETNSGQVLLDTTAQAATNLPSGKTLDDALSQLSDFDGRYKIGDVFTTTRTNMSNKWLLCNGATVNSSSYPELSQFFPSASSTFFKFSENTVSNNEIRRHNTYKLAVRTTESNDVDMMMLYTEYMSGTPDRVYYKNSSDENWNIFGSGKNRLLKTLNNKIFLISQTLGDVTIQYCDSSPISTSSFITLPKPTGDMTNRTITDGVYLDGKYYFRIVKTGGNAYDGVLMYTSLDSQPQVINSPSNIGSVFTAEDTGEIGIVGNQIVMADHKSYGESERYTTSFWTVENNIGVKFSIQPFENKAGELYLSLYSFQNKYFTTTRTTSGPSRNLSLYEITDLTTGTTSLIKSITSSYSENKFNVKNFLITNDKIFCSDKTYLDANLQSHSWDNASSITQTLCGDFVETNSHIYTICPQFEVWRSSKAEQFTLPTYSPATGLYAYIKAKN